MGVPLKTENEENPGERMQTPGSKGGRRVFQGPSKAYPAWTDTGKSPPASPVALR
jgi:hypothetical protein